MTTTRRLCMWSGPRNISTTMMRSFENRPDTAVIDEPFYAAYLEATGFKHPMRAEVLRAQPTDWRVVAAELQQAAPAPLYFQKHMTQHILPHIDLQWAAEMQHFFLIRDPALMAASFAKKMGTVTPDDLGVDQQAKLFAAITALTGTPPPIVDAQDILGAPEQMLRRLCEALGISFADEMLSWPAGPRETDGVWASHWYDAVHQSTTFMPPKHELPQLAASLQATVDAVRPAYDALHQKRLRPNAP